MIYNFDKKSCWASFSHPSKVAIKSSFSDVFEMVFRVNLLYHLEHAAADDDADADAVIEVITKWPRELFYKNPRLFFCVSESWYSRETPEWRQFF